MSDVNTSYERREHLELRAVYPLVFEALRPYFDQDNQWEGHSHEHFAYRTLKEKFPSLSAQECFIAVATAKRMFACGVFPQTQIA